MPPLNAEVKHPVVRRWMETFDTDADGFQEVLHPDVEWFPIEENQSRYQGIEEAMRVRERWLETWEVHDFDLEEVIERGDDVVVCVHILARGQTSGAAVDLRFYAQFKVRDGKVVRIFDHRERGAALDAAGLAEATDH